MIPERKGVIYMSELMTSILVKSIVALIVSIITKIIFKKKKSHSNPQSKSGFELDIKIKFKK